MAADDSGQQVAPDAALIDIVIGPQAKISPGLREALDVLAKVIEQRDEVQGYFNCSQVTWEGCGWLIRCSAVS